MTKNPVVSVIITTFQRPIFLAKTLKTVLCQTYNNLEIIVVDDGSKDNTKDVVNSFGDNRISFFTINHSGRPAVPRNFGLRKAKGELIAFCDDDDLWHPNKIEEQVKIFQSNANIKLCCTGFSTINEKDEEIEIKRIIDKLTKKNINFDNQLRKNDITFSTVMIHKNVLANGLLFDENPSLRASEDYLFLTNIVYLHCAYYIPKPLVKYRIHKYGISYTSESVKKMLLYYYRIVVCMVSFFLSHKISTYKFVFLLHLHLLDLVKQIIFLFYIKFKKIWRINV